MDAGGVRSLRTPESESGNGESRALQDVALGAHRAAEEAAARRSVERFIARRRVGDRLLRDVLGVTTHEWQPFGQEAATEVDGVFLSTGRAYGGFTTTDVLHFWRANSDGGNEKLEVRSPAALGRFIENYGIDYRPAAAPHFGGSASCSNKEADA